MASMADLLLNNRSRTFFSENFVLLCTQRAYSGGAHRHPVPLVFEGASAMEFYDVIKTRRSVRRFLKKAIPVDVLDRVLEAAGVAPSGGDRQPWRFVVVKDKQKKQRIARACYGQDFVAEAPVVLVCCSIKCSSGYEPWEDEAGRRDAVIATDHLILAARNEGLGTCWVGALHDKQVKEIVNVPGNVSYT